MFLEVENSNRLQTLRPTGTSLIREGKIDFQDESKNLVSPPDKGDAAKPMGFGRVLILHGKKPNREGMWLDNVQTELQEK